MQGYNYPREYIAAQGPKPNTGHDFWRMVLQDSVESIVMLTSLVENNKDKCHEYFPKLNGLIRFANLSVTCKSEEVHPTFIKRVLEAEKVCRDVKSPSEHRLTFKYNMQAGVKHAVKHYYFTCWPDHGVPSDTAGLIEFCKTVRSERKRLNKTIIVHCRFA